MSNLSRKGWEDLSRRMLIEALEENESQITMKTLNREMEKLTRNQLMTLSTKLLFRKITTNKELMNYTKSLMESSNQNK